jgi:hypothetical protein
MDALSQQWASAPSWAKLVTLAALPATGYAIARFLDEYRDWRAVGPGGLPYNVRGFIMNLLLTGIIARKETKSLGMYDQPEKYAAGWKQTSDEEKRKAKQSFLKAPLKQREGVESNALHFVAPQRERNMDDLKFVDPAIQEVRLTRGLKCPPLMLTMVRHIGPPTNLSASNTRTPSPGRLPCSRSRVKPCSSVTPIRFPL